LILPIQAGGQIIGIAEVIGLHDRQPFTPSQVRQSLLTTLDLAPHFAREPLRNQRGQLFESARSLLRAAGADLCSLYTWRADRPTLRWRLAYGTGLWFEETGPTLDVASMPTLQVVLTEQRIAVLRSTSSSLLPEEQPLFETARDSAMLALPLVFKDLTVGLVQLYDTNPGRDFTARELSLARALASQAAVALENSRLVRDLQRSLAEQRAMQSHLVRSARLSALGELSAVVAHQINNPLTTILGDAEILAQDLPKHDPLYESSQAILRAGQRAKRVVERMLTMTRTDGVVTAQSVNQTIEEVLELVAPQIVQQGIDLDVALASALPPVAARAGQLEDVWMNLLINARDALEHQSDPPPRIELVSRLSEQGDVVEVVIGDNGSGIPPEIVEQVFDPFFTTKPRGKGSGLGLYICHQIVRDHRGDIQIDTAPGSGTRVTVSLLATLNQPSSEEA
jgi:signal transduction histidine kinase